MERWKTGLAIAGSVCSLGGMVGGVWLGARGKADASEVRAHDKRLTVVEVKIEDDREWKRWMVDQLSRMSRHMGVQVAPPPVLTEPAYGPQPQGNAP